MTDLITAVDALTRPTRTKVIRDDNTTVTVDHDPLLVQLEAAITGAVGTDAGNGGQSTGNVLNDAAMYLLVTIGSQIRGWCRDVGVKPSRRPSDNLRAWMVPALAFPDPRGFVRMMETWAEQVRSLLDPPKRVPLADPCVACGADKYVTAEGDERRYPVVVEYDPSVLHASLRAVCRVCEVTWDGADAVTELVDEMKERHPIAEDNG